MMQFHKLDSRRLRVTDLPSTVEGLRVDAKELEVIVSYVGDPGGRKAIVLDNVVVPLMLAAPAMLDALRATQGWLSELAGLVSERKFDAAEDWVAACADWIAKHEDEAEDAIAQATNEEVNA